MLNKQILIHYHSICKLNSLIHHNSKIHLHLVTPSSETVPSHPVAQYTTAVVKLFARHQASDRERRKDVERHTHVCRGSSVLCVFVCVRTNARPASGGEKAGPHGTGSGEGRGAGWAEWLVSLFTMWLETKTTLSLY